MRSRYSHIYTNAIKSLGKAELLRKIRQIVQPGEAIYGRKTYYGQNIFNNLTAFSSVFNIDPRDLAICFHLFFNLPITQQKITSKNMEILLNIKDFVINAFEHNILSMFYRCYPKERKNKLSSEWISKKRRNTVNHFENHNNFMKNN